MVVVAVVVVAAVVAVVVFFRFLWICCAFCICIKSFVKQMNMQYFPPVKEPPRSEGVFFPLVIGTIQYSKRCCVNFSGRGTVAKDNTWKEKFFGAAEDIFSVRNAEIQTFFVEESDSKKPLWNVTSVSPDLCMRDVVGRVNESTVYACYVRIAQRTRLDVFPGRRRINKTGWVSHERHKSQCFSVTQNSSSLQPKYAICELTQWII